jgi:hypothetical protein
MKILKTTPTIPVFVFISVFYVCFVLVFSKMSHSRKHPYLAHGGNWKLTPPIVSVLGHLKGVSETIFSPLRRAEISSVRGVCIFSGMTQCSKPHKFVAKFIMKFTNWFVNKVSDWLLNQTSQSNAQFENRFVNFIISF